MITLFNDFDDVLIQVALALAPLVLCFLFFQIFILKLPMKRVKRIIQGIILSYIGLSLFLQGIYNGYWPVGIIMGERIAELKYNWILVPFGLILGFTSTLAEPAVRVLINEVEKVTGGHINKTLMLYSLCIGGAIAVSLSMIRVLTGISIMWFIVPLYVTAFVLTKFVSADFISIAFDSGGVATGPMTATFILAMVIGVADNLSGRTVMMDGFGVVAIVAVMPIVTILLLGFLYRIKEGKGGR